MAAWKERLEAQSVTTCSLQELVASLPMHLADIEHYSRQATIQTIIKGGAGKP